MSLHSFTSLHSNVLVSYELVRVGWHEHEVNRGRWLARGIWAEQVTAGLSVMNANVHGHNGILDMNQNLQHDRTV